MAMASTNIEVSSQQTMYEKVEQVNALLLAQEPGNISEDEYSHYTGYKPQSIKNAMNKVFGLGMWGYQEIASEVVKDDSGKPLIIGKVQVWIVGVDWKPEAWGQSRIMRGDIGDAHKSMVTDGMKKGLSDFSIGDRAYLGLLPGKKEQEAQTRAENSSANKQGQSAKPAQATSVAPRTQPSAKVQPAPARSFQPVSATPLPQQTAAEAQPVQPAKPAEPTPIQNGNAPRPVHLNALQIGANKHYPKGKHATGWDALKEKIAEEFNILGDVTDELIVNDYNIDAQAFVKEAMKFAKAS